MLRYQFFDTMTTSCSKFEDSLSQTCSSRLGCVPRQLVDECKLRILVSALVVGDLSTAQNLLSETPGLCFDRRVITPFGGHRVYPLQALVGCPAAEAEKCDLAERLHACGASMNVHWADTSGEHSPLSKALSLRQLALAECLLRCGACPSVALLETSLLEESQFDPSVVQFLLDHGADVRVPAVHPPRTCGGSSGGSSSAVVGVLGKCGATLHTLRHLSSLHAAPGGDSQQAQHAQQQALLYRVAHIVTLLLAAGAPPFRTARLQQAQQRVDACGTRFLDSALWGLDQDQMPPQDPAHVPFHGALSQHPHPSTMWPGAQHLRPFGGPTQGGGDPSGLGSGGVQPPKQGVVLCSERGLGPSLGQMSLHHTPPPSCLPRRADLAAATPCVTPPFPSLQPCTAAGSTAARGEEGTHPVAPPLGLAPQDWHYLAPFASQAPVWTPATHHLFPRPLRLAIRELVMINRCRGFPASGTAACLGRGPDAGVRSAAAQPQEEKMGECGHENSGRKVPWVTCWPSREGSFSCQRFTQSCKGAQPGEQEQDAAPAAVVWLDGNALERIICHLQRVW